MRRGTRLALAALLAAGCAEGGAAVDAGAPRPPFDAGRDGGAGSGVRGDAGPVPFDVDAGRPRDDGGMDAAPPPDAGPRCATAADCDDGRACNGLEACVGGRCEPGAAFVCSDDVACTVDRCLEPAAGDAPTCAFTPDDGRCPVGERCGATGCAAPCEESPCRLVGPQCGCPAEQGCYVSAGSRVCAAAGALPVGSGCGGAFPCEPGAFCLEVGDASTSLGQCHGHCDDDADCPGDALCVYAIADGSGGTVPDAALCSPGCDPLTRAGCAGGTGCGLAREEDGARRWFTVCFGPRGTGAQGSTCADSRDCAPGHVCLTNDRCAAWCNYGTGTGCAGGTTCRRNDPPLVVGATEYGFCL